MPPFHTVAGGRAGPHALGILVPPGPRTLIVIRPRALPFDLVVLQREATSEGFFEMDRLQAGLAAQQLGRALLEGTASADLAAIESADGFWLRIQFGPWALLACPREPGQTYRPQVFATLDDTQRVADQLRAVLCPPADANRELYTNLSQFGRSPLARG